LEKRRVVRYHLEEFVRLEGEKEKIPATMVDLSRSGMRVIINKPIDFNKVKRISVKLPGIGGEGIPCQIRRNVKGVGGWEFGLEFSGETNAQVLLVNRWIDSLEKHTNQSEPISLQSRRAPRMRCTITDIECTNRDLVIYSAQNISTRGVLIQGSGELKSGDMLSLEMNLPVFSCPISIETRVVYLIDSGPENPFQAGLSIVRINATSQDKLQQFVSDTSHNLAILEYHKQMIKDESSERFQISGTQAITMFHKLRNEASTVNLLDEENLCIIETHIEEFEGINFKVASPETVSNPTFFSFTRDGASYFFSAKRKSWNGGYGEFQIPVRVYRGEKRAEKRKTSSDRIKLRIPSISEPVPVQILNSSRKGMQVEVYSESLPAMIPVIGGTLEIAVGEETIPGEIRHIVEHLGNTENQIVYRVGLETGIRRKTANAITYSPDNWIETWHGPSRPLRNKRLLQSERVSYKDYQGREIVGLLHVNNPKLPAIVIIIPPAFARKKESFATLALTLLTNFAAVGENIAVLRYDGTNRPGESANSNPDVRPGNEMVGYRINQSYTDLETTMNWVHNNGKVQVDKTALITFDMAALEARRLQTSLENPQADHWISVMGVASAQNALKNMLCGLDAIANHRMGIPVGTMNLCGQQIDMDRMIADIIHLGYTTTSDAREAMAQIESPITWIYGTHDKWTDPEEIRDIMSVASPGERELIEIPSTHNLRASDDGIASFQIISDAILRQLAGSSGPAVMPDNSELTELIARERESVIGEKNLDIPGFWKSYMLGDRIDGGYDNYGELAEFQEFAQLELALLKPMVGESIADMGCGTGLITQAILFDLGTSITTLAGTKLIGIDLIPELLTKANEKYNRLSKKNPKLKEVEITWKSLNLEPFPLAGIRDVLNQPGAKFIEQLRGKVQGVSCECFDKFRELDRELMSEILEGKTINASIRQIIEKSIGPKELALLEDINLGARFIVGNLTQKDLKISLGKGTEALNAQQLQNLRSSDLALQKLDFGSWTRDGKLPLEDDSFDAIYGSLLLPYLFAPAEAVKEFTRMLKPGGRILLSTMKPDFDILSIFSSHAKSSNGNFHEKNLEKVHSMLGEAAKLLSLEEDGWFRFLSEEELRNMMVKAGLAKIQIVQGLGAPPQAIIATGKKELTSITTPKASRDFP